MTAKRIASAAAGALLFVLGFAPAASAHWVADDTIVLQPYDPVPQIQFRHWDGPCVDDCWIERHCGYDCQGDGEDYGRHRHDYGERDYGERDCDDWRDRDHFAWHHDPCPGDLVAGYLDRAKRSDDQSDQWEHSMDHWNADIDWYDHDVIGAGHHDEHGDHDHDHH